MKQTKNELLRSKLYKLSKKLCKLTGTETIQVYTKAFEKAAVALAPSFKKVSFMSASDSEWQIIGETEFDGGCTMKTTCFLTSFTDERLQSAIAALETEIAARSTCAPKG